LWIDAGDWAANSVTDHELLARQEARAKQINEAKNLDQHQTAVSVAF